MGLAARIALAVVIVTVDLVTFFVPLCALVVAWVIVVRPEWTLEFIVKLYDGVSFGPGAAPGRGAVDEPPGPPPG